MRDAPAYQEYPATMMANIRYRLMALAQRGLMDTMRRECWMNGGLPANPVHLARMLGYDAEEIEAALPAVMPFFKQGQDGLITCPELEDLRATYAERREKQAAGGQQSAANRKGRKSENDAASSLQGTSKQPASSLQVRRQVKTKPNQSKAVSKEAVIPCDAYKEWMGDDDAYRQVSDGG